jgi:tetratricopeptide (TPR) repeat protein/predicted Ser/Thr protein kinase
VPISSEQWARIKEVFHAALEWEPPERLPFVRGTCADDLVVCTEIERLLAAHAEAGGFIEPPVNAFGGRIGKYEVGRLIGTGGMGEVYAARDTELGRDVVLKLATATDADSHARLRREAQHASQLNHPHICTIYEVGTHEGRPFIAMEYVEGRPLCDVIPQVGLPVDVLVRYGIQISEALAYAHRNGVIHRDLKTLNIIVKSDGRTKILDFGLARRLSQRQLSEASESRSAITAEGMIAGTLPYVAPEVLRGESADERSDIWALGVLLYEAATGGRPFLGATGFELCGAILHSVPPTLPDRLPVALRSIIQHCLVKDPQNRFQSAEAVRLALERAHTPSTRAGTRRKVAVVVAVLLAIGLGAAAIWRDGFTEPRASTVAAGPSGRPAIAVMSFDVAGASDADGGWLSRGVPRMLLTGLAQTRGLDVVSTRRLVETARQIRAGDLETLDRSQAAAVARRAGAGAMVVGSIFRSGSEIRIDAQVEDLDSGRVLVAESARGTDVFSIVDQLASRIRSGIGLENTGEVRKVADVSTSSLGAYRLFAQGADAYEHFRMKDAHRLLTEAVRVDPSFASAYLCLGSVSYFEGRMADRKMYFTRAKEHIERLNERERLLLQANIAHAAGDGIEAARVIDQLIAQFPDTEDAYVEVSQLYTPVNGLLYDPEKQIAILRRGTEMVPGSGLLRNLYGYALIEAGEIDRGLAEFEQYVRLSPDEPNAYDSLGEANLAGMMPEKALEYYARANTIQPDFSAGGLAVALAMLGRFDEVVAQPTQDSSIQEYTIRAVIVSRTGRYKDAESILAAGRKRPEENKHAVGHAAAYLVSSMLETERGQYARARADANTARTILGSLSTQESRVWLAFANLLSGTALARERNVRAAQTALESFGHHYNPRVPSERQWYGALAGEIALASGDLDGAAAAFAASVPDKRYWWSMNPNTSSVLINSPQWKDGAARVAKGRGDWAGAIEAYRSLNAISPNRKWASIFEPRYVLEVARLLEKSGDAIAARAEYQKFLAYWKKADTDLPELAEARRAVARLK